MCFVPARSTSPRCGRWRKAFSQLGPALGLPDWATRWFLVAAVIGFPFWIAFAWFFEFTPEGIKRERDVEPDESITHHTGRKLDFAIIGVLVVAVVLLVTDRFVLHHGVNEEAAIPVAAALDCGAAVRRHVLGQGSGILLRRHLRRTAEPAGEDSAAAGDGTHVVVLVQGQRSCDPRDRARTARRQPCSKVRCASPATQFGSRRS